MGILQGSLICPQPLTPSQIADLRLAASPLTGGKRRPFEAERALKYCEANPLPAETRLCRQFACGTMYALVSPGHLVSPGIHSPASPGRSRLSLTRPTCMVQCRLVTVLVHIVRKRSSW